MVIPLSWQHDSLTPEKTHLRNVQSSNSTVSNVTGTLGRSSPVFMHWNLAPPKSTALKLARRRLIFSKIAFSRLTSENVVADRSDSLKCDIIQTYWFSSTLRIALSSSIICCSLSSPDKGETLSATVVASAMGCRLFNLFRSC